MIRPDKTQIMAGFFNRLIHVTSKQAFHVQLSHSGGRPNSRGEGHNHNPVERQEYEAICKKNGRIFGI
jgi:hypothetical protein